jgi:hypothetical protein
VPVLQSIESDCRARGARRLLRAQPMLATSVDRKALNWASPPLLIAASFRRSPRGEAAFHSWLTLMTHVAGVKAGSKTLRVLGAHSTLLTGSLIANSLGRDRKLSITKAPATVSLLQYLLWVRSGALAKAERRRGESRPLGCLLSPWIEASIGTSDLHTYRLFDSGGTCSLGELWPRSLGNLWSLASFR